jgi:hypothetical protein
MNEEKSFPYHGQAPSNPDAVYPSAVNSPLRPGSAGKNSNEPLSSYADDDSSDESED